MIFNRKREICWVLKFLKNTCKGDNFIFAVGLEFYESFRYFKNFHETLSNFLQGIRYCKKTIPFKRQLSQVGIKLV